MIGADVMKKAVHAFVDLSSEDAEQIIHELGRALDSDREWAAKFRTMLICRTKPKKADLNPDSHKDTEFGRWYYGQVNSKLRDHPGFTAIGKNSEHMHALALKLALAIQEDINITPRQYKAFMKSVDLFRGSLRTLLSEAWDFLRYADPLTGVMTRGAMDMYLEAEQERTNRSEQSSCIAMMDLDLFKKVNDTHGHQAGDKVLETLAGYLQENLRRYDQVFRYGGEEFLILLPNTTTTNSKRVLDRLRQNIKSLAIEIAENKTLHVSVSFGIAQLLSNKPAKVSINFADQALYEAKKAGRNCIRIWQRAEKPGDLKAPDRNS